MTSIPFTEPQEVLGLTVSDLLERWPEAVQVLFDFHLACIGCSYSRFSTLEQALELQGIDGRAFLESLLLTISEEREQSRLRR